MNKLARGKSPGIIVKASLSRTKKFVAFIASVRVRGASASSWQKVSGESNHKTLALRAKKEIIRNYIFHCDSDDQEP